MRRERMRLSEAMRIGASWSKSIRLVWKRDDGTCALGAAYEGTFGTIKGALGTHPLEESVRLKAEYRILSRGAAECPVSNMCPKDLTNTVMQMIAHLNDNHDWSREKIADWIETLEPKPEPKPAEEELVHV